MKPETLLTSVLALSMCFACSEGTNEAESTATGDDDDDSASDDDSAADGPTEAGGADDVAPEDIDLSIHQYLPDDPKIQYSGRIDFEDPEKPSYSAAGAYITAHFRGDSILAAIADEYLYGRRNYYEVIVDGQFVQKLAPEAGADRFMLADGLEPGDHTLVLAKRTESSIGSTTFLGFEVTGVLLDPPAKPERRIEFIGDSITAGAGVEAANNSPECSEDSWGEPYNNNYLSYGPVAARALGAEYQVTAVSGIGLTVNYSQMYDARTMADVYELLYLEDEDSPEYDRSQFTPDVVVVALGTNDFSPGDSERPPLEVEPYIDAYVAFVERLRGYYPEAHIFCLSSPMLGDGWPDESYTSATSLKETIAATEAHFSDAGDDRVHAFEVAKLSGQGCGTHPNVEQHATLGEELAEEIAAIVGWE